MNYQRILSQTALGLFIAAAVVACGGGGSSPSGPTIAPSVTLSAHTAQLPQGSSLIFSCGCTGQAGTASVASAGVISLAGSTTATPASPNPTYTLNPGSNLVVIGTSPTNLQQWSMAFVGNTSANNKYLGGSATVDNYSTLAALYIFSKSPASLGGTPNSTATFGDWNFATVSSWVTSMRSGTVTAAETQALTDINSAQNAGTLLYPQVPNWNAAQVVNSTIQNDLDAISTAGTAADATLPTPCPINNGTVACTNAPTP